MREIKGQLRFSALIAIYTRDLKSSREKVSTRRRENQKIHFTNPPSGSMHHFAHLIVPFMVKEMLLCPEAIQKVPSKEKIFRWFPAAVLINNLQLWSCIVKTLPIFLLWVTPPLT
jgi:predicted benzoate:H+ symporter BenE